MIDCLAVLTTLGWVYSQGCPTEISKNTHVDHQPAHVQVIDPSVNNAYWDPRMNVPANAQILDAVHVQFPSSSGQ